MEIFLVKKQYFVKKFLRKHFLKSIFDFQQKYFFFYPSFFGENIFDENIFSYPSSNYGENIFG